MISKIIPEEKIIACLKAINKASKILIISHKGPDGDSIGSSLALYNFLVSQGKDTWIMIPDEAPGRLMFLPGSDNIIVFENDEQQAADLLKSCDLLFCLDFNEPKRAGKAGTYIINSKARKVMVDHHPDPDNFADIIISHPEICATSELVFRIICRMGYFPEMNKETAECICAGMLSDTGGLAYNSNNPELYTIFTELLKKGVDKDDIYRRVITTSSENRLRLMGHFLLNCMKVYPEAGWAVSCMSAKDLKKFGYRTGDTDGLVNLPLQIPEINCSVFVREDNGCVKLSFRSKGDFAVNGIASKLFSGGGHKNAAGAESTDSMEEIVRKLEQYMDKHISD